MKKLWAVLEDVGRCVENRRESRLSPEEQPPLRQLFRWYLDARLAIYDSLPDFAAARQRMRRATELQQVLLISVALLSAGDAAESVLRELHDSIR